MWQELRTELAPKGAEIVTVALDTGGAAAAESFVRAAAPEHPSLIDEAHVAAERFGFVNVPNAVWIDEAGMIVRPSHAAHVRKSGLRDMEIPEGLGVIGEVLAEVKKFNYDPDTYRAAIADWVEHGAESRYALSPQDVIERSRPRSSAHAEAAAAFELAQHLHRSGHPDDAVPWFRRAHELHPENWTYKRQAWTFVTTPEGQPSDLLQGENEVYDGNWLKDVRELGAESYYEVFEA